jgi:hypothetical protein
MPTGCHPAFEFTTTPPRERVAELSGTELNVFAAWLRRVGGRWTVCEARGVSGYRVRYYATEDFPEGQPTNSLPT